MNNDLSAGKKDHTGNKIYKEPCPVCGSLDTDESLEQTFHGVPHHFCSAHCSGRFARRPHLYVGTPAQKTAVKQQGKIVEKSHHVVLQRPLPIPLQQTLAASVQALPGVAQCSIDGADLKVRYDLIVISLKDVEKVVEQVAGPLSDSLTERAKRKALHFGEENELDNLGHLSGNGAHYRF